MFFLRKYKPQTPGTRHRVNNIQFENLKKQKHFFFINHGIPVQGEIKQVKLLFDIKVLF